MLAAAVTAASAAPTLDPSGPLDSMVFVVGPSICALGTTLRILIPKYKLRVMDYSSSIM